MVVVVRTDDARVRPHTSVGAPNWSARTPESQTPGVAATNEPSTTNSCWPSRAGLDVQLDGVRKLPQLVEVVVVRVGAGERGGGGGETVRNTSWMAAQEQRVSSIFVFP